MARLIDPRSKLATAQALQENTPAHSLGQTLDLADIDEEPLYQALDWLGKRLASIECQLARRHFNNGSVVLYHVTSSYFERAYL